MTFTTSPASGRVDASIPLVLSGVGTLWTDPGTAFVVIGGANASLFGLTIISATQAVTTLQTGTAPGSVLIREALTQDTANFLVTPVVGASTFSYDPTTPVGNVRLKIGDMDISSAGPDLPREEWSCLFTDQEVQLFLDDWGGDPDRAAIQGLRYIAARPQMQLRAMHILNLDMELGDLSGALNNLADEILRSRNMVPEEYVAEMGLNDFSRRQIILHRIMRRGGNIV